MTCPRCHGLLIQDIVYCGESQTNHLPIERCINCGYVEDAVIRARRRAVQLDREVQPL